ncbi:MAG: HPF/RaiA family ribosome-associated protein [candidate division Zixibacteria bacterium]|nr:HPF/RaiA family ribosome-associated protein [candidate division Zixibacteria bacterium]
MEVKIVEVPLELTFREMEKDPEVEKYILEKVDKLESISKNIISCSVVVEKPQKHQQEGNPYRFRIVITIPGDTDVVVSKGGNDSPMHAPLKSIVKDAFEVAKRQLIEVNDKRRYEVKEHPEQEMGAVVDRLFKNEGYGFLKTIDNREVYFHENSVVNDDFKRLEVGTGVRYSETAGDKGPQATTVQIVNKPGARLPSNPE